MVYLINRYYEPATGQFLSIDPMVDQTEEPYGYTGADPVNEADPSGDCISFFALVCPGPGPVSSTVEFGFHPKAAWQAVINLGDGFAQIGSSGTECNPLEEAPYVVGQAIPFVLQAIADGGESSGSSGNDDPEDGFTPPETFVNRRGQLSNGAYTIDQAAQDVHQRDSFVTGKSQWFSTVDGETATLDAAAYADAHNLWRYNTAKVPVANGYVGSLG